jgi:hypothetical protein
MLFAVSVDNLILKVCKNECQTNWQGKALRATFALCLAPLAAASLRLIIPTRPPFLYLEMIRRYLL